MLPSWKIENMRRRVERARKGPHITCPASRHLHGILEALWKERAKNHDRRYQ